MKDLAGTVIAAAAKDMAGFRPFIRALEVILPGSPKTAWRLANYDRDVAHDTNGTGVALTYQRYPFALGEFRESRQGDLSQLQVNVANVTRELMEHIDPNEGLIGARVKVLVLHSDALDDPAAKRTHEGKIIAAEVDQDVAIFTIGQPNLNQQVCPGRRYLTSCGVVRFSDSACGYAPVPGATNVVGGGFDFCPRTLAACRERGDDEVARGLTRKHPRRFDGYVGIRSGNP